MTGLAILACYAHPDDEQGVSGTLARYADQGVRTGLICATRGELGEIADPRLATSDALGLVREQEMYNAAMVIKLRHVWFLDYRDSGMRGTPGNQDRRAFINADEREAMGKIIRIIRAFKPTAIITFDESGAYGHPDHLRIHFLATQAFSAAADASQYPEAGPAWETKRLFYASPPRRIIRQTLRLAEEAGISTNFTGMDVEILGLPDEQITHQIDIQAYTEHKRESLYQHRTQMKLRNPLAHFPEGRAWRWQGLEYFALVAGLPLDWSDRTNDCKKYEVPGDPHSQVQRESLDADMWEEDMRRWGTLECFALASGVPLDRSDSAAMGDLLAGLYTSVNERQTVPETLLTHRDLPT